MLEIVYVFRCHHWPSPATGDAHAHSDVCLFVSRVLCYVCNAYEQACIFSSLLHYTGLAKAGSKAVIVKFLIALHVS